MGNFAKSLFAKVGAFLRKYVYNDRWRCNSCGKEIFSGSFFCDDCEKSLPRNDKEICNHCGRQVTESAEYCLTCKGNLTSLDKCRSVFNYEGEIKKLIRKAKYDGKKYILDYFAEELERLCVKCGWAVDKAADNIKENAVDSVAHNTTVNSVTNATDKVTENAADNLVDNIVAVPMTIKALRKRGYNQSLLLAEKLSIKTGVKILDCLTKIKETPKQATLKRLERIKNLDGAFRVTDKKAVEGKRILIVDDVTTTGSTAEVLASRLKRAGAKQVFLLTVASVPTKDGY